MSHFCASSHARVKGGCAELLVISFKEAGSHNTRTKFAGGGNEEDETPIETAAREAVEELGGEEFLIYNLTEIHQSKLNGHTKHFYLLDYEGGLRQEEMTESDGTILSAPFYEDVKVLYHDSRFVPTHRLALEEFIVHFANVHEEFFWAYRELGLDPRARDFNSSLIPEKATV